jgi:hypothetical protein
MERFYFLAFSFLLRSLEDDDTFDRKFQRMKFQDCRNIASVVFF